MVSELLKVLEIVLNTVRAESTSDKRREKCAKELLRIYVDIGTVVDRGREILDLLQAPTDDHCGRAITLLSLQQQSLQELAERLRTGTVGDILQLHAPNLSTALVGFMEVKGHRVWLTLDWLVSDGEPIAEHEWIDRLARRMVPGKDPRDIRGIQYSRAVNVAHLQARITMFSSSFERQFIVLASQHDIEDGHALLNRIASAREALRQFLVEKFRLEDVL